MYNASINEITNMNKILKLLNIGHILWLTNITIFVIITFITWDFLWWWSVGDWDWLARILFLCMVAGINGCALNALEEWKKKNR